LNEKKEATARAVQYLADHGLPANTPIERVSQGTESASFKSEFHVWDAPISFHMNAKVGYGVLYLRLFLRSSLPRHLRRLLLRHSSATVSA
jgi:hypothetical protein